MSIKIFFTFLFFLLFAAPVYAQSDCLAVAAETNLRCDNLGASYSVAADQSRCGYMGADSTCCCKQTAQSSPLKPKYIIMAAVAVVFGTAAVISFVIRKRELE